MEIGRAGRWYGAPRAVVRSPERIAQLMSHFLSLSTNQHVLPFFGRDALKKGGDRRKHQMALVPQGPEGPSAAGVFDGPFPVVNGETRLDEAKRDGRGAHTLALFPGGQTSAPFFPPRSFSGISSMYRPLGESLARVVVVSEGEKKRTEERVQGTS